MSVGFISLLHQPALQQVGTIPEDAGRCFKPVFLPPSLSLDRHWENPVTHLSCAVFSHRQYDLTANPIWLSKLPPALSSKAQWGFGVDRGAPRRCRQPHTLEQPGPGVRWVHQGNQRYVARGHAEVLLLSPASALFVPSPWGRGIHSAFQLGNSSLPGENHPLPFFLSN